MKKNPEKKGLFPIKRKKASESDPDERSRRDSHKSPARPDKPMRMDEGKSSFSSRKPKKEDGKSTFLSRRPKKDDEKSTFSGRKPRRDDGPEFEKGRGRSTGNPRLKKSYSGSEEREPRKYTRKPASSEQGPEKKSFSFVKNKRSFKSSENEALGKPHTKNPVKKITDEIRLNKYIANSGMCSRREADQYIELGLVSVNGEVVTGLGSKVKPGDEVKVNDQGIKNEKKVYVLMNKPKDCLTTCEDDRGRRTVLDLIGDGVKERIFPVGRLDRNTTGVLLLTNDGEMTDKLTHPSYSKSKIYQVTLDKKLTREDMDKIAKGIETEDGIIKVDEISYIDLSDHHQVGVELHTGQNRVVRRIFEYRGYKVKSLDRVYFAGLTKKGLPRGHWRFLSQAEVGMLFVGNYK